MMLVERSGYRIDSRTIKRGSRPSILIVSFVESSNLCILAIIFIGSFWLLSMRVVGAFLGLHDKPKFIENGFRMLLLLHFRFGRFCRIIFYRVFLPFPIWFYATLLDYDVSLHNLIVLVVKIPTSPRSSKTESGCKSYGHFCFVFSAVFHQSGSTGKIR